jgi:thiamine biosynthesis lipoprotein
MRMPARFALAAALITAAALIAAVRALTPRAAEAPLKFRSEVFDTFDTHVEFTAFAGSEKEFEKYAEIAHSEMVRFHRLFDIYNSYGGIANIRTINENAGIAPVRVDPAIVDLLEMARGAFEYTDGAINTALGPVLAIWHDYRQRAGDGEGTVPSMEELRAAAANVSVSDVLIDRDGGFVFLRRAGMSLDVGAVAKGYAVQRTVEALKEAGLRSGLINAGGNVAVIGKPQDGRETWSIGVRSPERGDGEGLLDVISLSSGSAVTSGNYQRYFTAEGRRYHHIIDPKTLFPAENSKAVTVLHPDSAIADILSTAAFILPPERARELITKHDAEALWVGADGRVTATAGYSAMSKIAENSGAARAPKDTEPGQ